MTRDEAITRMRRYLGFNTRLDSAVIVDALKDAQVELESRPELPWFLITEVASISTTAGEQRVAVPSDFIREYEREALYLYNKDDDKEYAILEKRDADDLRKEYSEEEDDRDEPKFYALDGKYFRLFPIPDDIYTLKLIYYAEDTKLDNNVENEWLKHAPYLMIGLAGMFIARMTRDQNARETFQEMAQLSSGQLDREMEAREAANRRYIMGGKD